MAPLTGGCHYAWECTGYTDRCGNCPALYSTPWTTCHRASGARKSVHRKNEYYPCPATGWLEEQTRRSALFKEKKIEKILLGVDPDTFKACTREIPRKRFGLPLDRKIIFFGAQSLKSRRKGLAYLVEALHVLLKKRVVSVGNIMLITSGYERNVRAYLGGSIPYAHLGFLGDESSLAAAYQAADLFVCPSIEDSGPMMINEAIMCGPRSFPLTWALLGTSCTTGKQDIVPS